MIRLPKDMFLINRYIFIILICNILSAHSLSNTTNDIPDTFSNLTVGNDLWSGLLKNCQKPTISCIRDNIYRYLKSTLDYPDEVQFTGFLNFPKNSVDYTELQKRFDETSNDTDSTISFDDESPVEQMSRSLRENTMKFFMTHDVELQLPETFFLGTTLKISPRSFEGNGTLVKLELLPKTVQNSIGEGRIFFKKIRQFISERLIYALLAILLVIKLLAVKLLFVLPAVVGVAAAKKLILKVLLFLFPALHHLFNLCAYVPHGAKHHIHKHQISHIHEVSHGHHHHASPHKYHKPIEVVSSHAEEPPSLHQYSDPHKEYFEPYESPDELYPGDAYYGNEIISHRKDPTQEENELDLWGHGQTKRPARPANIGRPLTQTEIENMILKTEKEALIKARLQKEKQRIQEENLRLQEQLNHALKTQENLKLQAAAIYNSKKLQSVNPPNRRHNSAASPNRYLQTPHVEPPVISNSIEANSLRHHIVQGQVLVPQIPQAVPVPQIPQAVSVPQIPQAVPVPQIPQAVPVRQIPQTVPVPQIPQRVLVPQIPQTLSISQISQIVPQITQHQHLEEPHVAHVQAQPQYDLDDKREKHVQKVETEVIKKPNLRQDVHKAASITYDSFYTPILERIDKIFQGLGFYEEPCRERLICSMYKNPENFSPHSNLLSVELSRDTKDLQKPTSTNAAVIRFYRYVQAARDGQDKRDCARLYPACAINTEI